MDHLSDYIGEVGWPTDNISYTAAVSDADGVRHLQLLGGDIRAAIYSRYETLVRLMTIVEELINAVESHRADVVLGSELHDAVVSAVKAIPSTTPSEQQSLITAISKRMGTITLGHHTKKDAALIVQHLHDILAGKGMPLTPEERKKLTIKCDAETFPWFGQGPGGGKARDQVKHIVDQVTIKPSPLVEAWIANHPK